MGAGLGTSALVLLPTNGLMRDVAERESTTVGCIRSDVDLTVHGVGGPSPWAWLLRLLVMV